MIRPGIWELVIILLIVLVLFGRGRISKIAGEMGSGIRAFKDGLQISEEENKENDQEETEEENKENDQEETEEETSE